MGKNKQDNEVRAVLRRRPMAEPVDVSTLQATADKKILDQLDKLGETRVTEENLKFEGNTFVLPEAMRGDLGTAIGFLEELRKAEEEKYAFHRMYDYLPMDGAAAFSRAMQRVFGTQGVGKKIKTMFGDIDPTYITVKTNLNEEIQVPWNRIVFKPLGAQFDLSGWWDDEKDMSFFRIAVECPRKNRRHVEGFLQVIEDELRERSIYRGKAIDAATEPHFVDVHAVDPSRVVYARNVQRDLDAVWASIDHAEELRAKGIPLRHAVLLEGPYGSGKSLAGSLTGQKALAAGWTYILVRASDDPFKALQIAQMYAPCVIWIEDLDVHGASTSDRRDVSELLEALDGVNSKGKDVLAGFTTNFVTDIEKGVVRSGRIDTLIHVGAMDPDGYEQLIKILVPEKDLKEVDFKKVAKAFDGYMPSTAVQAIHRAQRHAVMDGKTHITTDELVAAADSVRPQFELVAGLREAQHKEPTIDEKIAEQFINTLQRTTVDGMRVEVNKR
jgi:ATPase family associated with various cellular activities (AAA)